MIVQSSIGVIGLGCAGGALAELLHWWGLRESGLLPAYGRSLFYWTITAAMIVAGGLVALLYVGSDHAEGIVVVHIGLSTPLILQKLVTSVPAPAGPKTMALGPAPTLHRFFMW